MYKPHANITIKKGPHGFYMDVPALGYTPSMECAPLDNDRSRIILKVGFCHPDVQDPLEPYVTIRAHDVNGTLLKIITTKENFIENVRQDGFGKDHPWLEEFVLSHDSNLWALLHQVDLDKV